MVKTRKKGQSKATELGSEAGSLQDSFKSENSNSNHSVEAIKQRSRSKILTKERGKTKVNKKSVTRGRNEDNTASVSSVGTVQKVHGNQVTLIETRSLQENRKQAIITDKSDEDEEYQETAQLQEDNDILEMNVQGKAFTSDEESESETELETSDENQTDVGSDEEGQYHSDHEGSERNSSFVHDTSQETTPKKVKSKVTKVTKSSQPR